jgi:hypothetical protein
MLSRDAIADARENRLRTRDASGQERETKSLAIVAGRSLKEADATDLDDDARGEMVRPRNERATPSVEPAGARNH